LAVTFRILELSGRYSKIVVSNFGDVSLGAFGLCSTSIVTVAVAVLPRD